VAGGLHGAGDLERELGEVELVLVEGDFALQHQAAEVAVGGDIVEAVVVHAGVRDVRGHELHGLLAPELEETLVAGRVVLEERHAELEALRPLGPAARGVSALHGEDGRALGRVPGLVDRVDLLTGECEHAVDFFLKLGGGQRGVDFHGEGMRPACVSPTRETRANCQHKTVIQAQSRPAPPGPLNPRRW
jgi:hypothetical protein